MGVRTSGDAIVQPNIFLRFRIVSLAEMVLYGIVPGHPKKFVTITTFEISPFSIPKGLPVPSDCAKYPLDR